MPGKDAIGICLAFATGALKWLKKWAEAAGVEKHIGFHTARRTFGTSLITYGSDVSIVSKLLGHTSLANTQRYVKVSEQLKQQAIAKLPSLVEKH